MVIKGKVKYKKMSNRLSLVSIKAFSSNSLYKRLFLKVKEFGHINCVSSINESKAVCSRVNKGSKGNSISIL